VFVQYGHDILEKNSQMLQKIKRMSSDLQSVLRFGMSPFYSKYYLPTVITQFLKSNPNVKLDIIEKISTSLEENVIEGMLDFCFVPEQPANPELEYHKVCIEDMYLAVPINYPIGEHIITSNGVPCLALKDVKNEPFVHLRKEQKFRQMCDATLKNAGFELQNIICETIGWDTVHIMVASGLGLGIVPELLTHTPYVDPRLRYYRISDVKLMRSYAVAYKKSGTLDEYAAQIVQLLISYISSKYT
jgi:LysR family hydrogen peroxide-inducible transcriptional activator